MVELVVVKNFSHSFLPMLVYTSILVLTYCRGSFSWDFHDNKRSISWDAVIWAIEPKYIVDICRSVEIHFGLKERSVSIFATESLNFLNGHGLAISKYSPREIHLVRFVITNMLNETKQVFEEYIKESAFVEIYEIHRERFGKEFVFTSWRDPIPITQGSELQVPFQTKNFQNCNWLAEVYPCGGLNNNLNSMMDGLVFAYFTGMAYLAPEVPVRAEMCNRNTPCASYLNETKWFKNRKSFRYIWDLENLERWAEWLGVKVEEKKPNCIIEKQKMQRTTNFKFLNGKEIQMKYSPCTKNNLTEDISYSETCYQGFMKYDCMFGSYHPEFNWGLWAVVRNSFRFSPMILQYANMMAAKIGGPFTTLHLRIEKDVRLKMAVMETWEEFFSILPKRFEHYKISKSDPVVVVTGLHSKDPKRARTIKALKEWNLLWPEHFEGIYGTLDGAAELERRAAVQYALCLQSTRHFGFWHSSFDVNLFVDRRLMNGHFSSGVFPIVRNKHILDFFQKTTYPALFPMLSGQ